MSSDLYRITRCFGGFRIGIFWFRFLGYGLMLKTPRAMSLPSEYLFPHIWYGKRWRLRILTPTR